MHRNNLFKRHLFVLASLSTPKLPQTSFLNTHFPHFTAGRLAPRFALYHLPSRDYRITCSVSTSHFVSSLTTAAPQGNEIRASEDPRAILRPSPAQIRHDQAKFKQPASNPKTSTEEFSKHRRFPDLSVTESCSICIEIIYLSLTRLY